MQTLTYCTLIYYMLYSILQHNTKRGVETNVVLRRRALAGECTAEEGAQKGIQHGRHSIDMNKKKRERTSDCAGHPSSRLQPDGPASAAV